MSIKSDFFNRECHVLSFVTGCKINITISITQKIITKIDFTKKIDLTKRSISTKLTKGYRRGNLHNRIHKVFILIYKVTDIYKTGNY